MMNSDLIFKSPLPSEQRGVALITVLLVMVFLSVLATNIAENQNISIRKISNLIESEQAFQIAIGGEQWSRTVLEEDIFLDANSDDSVSDHRQEAWANLGPAVKVEGTESLMLVRILELHGKFNLNNLIQGKNPKYKDNNAENEAGDESIDQNIEGSETGQSEINIEDEASLQAGDDISDKNKPKNTSWYAIFQSLLEDLEIEIEIADALVDWIDENDEVTGTFGAEDSYYLSLDNSYLPSNRPLLSIAELQRIKGFSPGVIVALLPYVTALPIAEKNQLTKINVNSVSAQLLSTLVIESDISPGLFDELLEARRESPFDSLEDFYGLFESITPFSFKPGVKSLLDVKGEYFLSHICAETGKFKLSQISLLRKHIEEVRVGVIYRYRAADCPTLGADDSTISSTN
jgi:general secretion pathway protein K